MTDLTYPEYLKLDRLLSLQVPRTPDDKERAVSLSEHFFVVTHQSCELWLKQIIADLNASVDALLPEDGCTDAYAAVEFLERSAELLNVVLEQTSALERLPVRHFAAFRPYLGTASGAESEQFRYLGRLLDGEQGESRLYEAFTTAARHDGTSVAEVCRTGPAAGPYHRVAEALVDIGNRYWRWKLLHLSVMSKMVGEGPGTGGTSGVAYLMSRATLPFTELRRERGRLHADLSERPSA